MACYAPVRVPVKRKRLNLPGYDYSARVSVGCGKCIGCRAEQSRNWMVRMVHESQIRGSGWFITLTYDDEHLPHDEGLDPYDFTYFVKGLRRHFPPEKLSFYGCGEYGSVTGRPHYHLCIFGPEFYCRDHYDNDDSGNPLFKSPTIEKCWPFGISDMGVMSPGAAAYTAGYVAKKVEETENTYTRCHPETGEIFEVHPEFSRMSLRPAIGRRWIEKYWRDVYPRDYVVIDGREIKPPRYYDKWMDEYHPEVMEEVRNARWERIAEEDELVPSKEKRRDLRAKQAHHEARNGLYNGRKAI